MTGSWSIMHTVNVNWIWMIRVTFSFLVAILFRVASEKDVLVWYIFIHIGICRDQEAIKTVGLDLLQSSISFWLCDWLFSSYRCLQSAIQKLFLHEFSLQRLPRCTRYIQKRNGRRPITPHTIEQDHSVISIGWATDRLRCWCLAAETKSLWSRTLACSVKDSVAFH